MKIEFECRRCSGRRRLPETGEECYVCLGKGVIKIEKKDLHHYNRKRTDQ